MNIKCILLTPTDKVEESLRRFSTVGKCSATSSKYHNVAVIINQRDKHPDDISGDRHPHDDPRWPTHCVCGYEFQKSDLWQLSISPLLCRSDNGELVTLLNAPVGAMWYTTRLDEADMQKGPDGRCLIVKLPDGATWLADSRASNCDSPCKTCGVPYNQHKTKNHTYVDINPEHRCWIRHGTPPDIHVDKNGNTCGAGAGSIATEKYHGFLHNGYLTNG